MAGEHIFICFIPFGTYYQIIFQKIYTSYTVTSNINMIVHNLQDERKYLPIRR